MFRNRRHCIHKSKSTVMVSKWALRYMTYNYKIFESYSAYELLENWCDFQCSSTNNLHWIFIRLCHKHHSASASFLLSFVAWDKYWFCIILYVKYLSEEKLSHLNIPGDGPNWLKIDHYDWLDRTNKCSVLRTIKVSIPCCCAFVKHH